MHPVFAKGNERSVQLLLQLRKEVSKTKSRAWPSVFTPWR
jgi:hypothetical protein